MRARALYLVIQTAAGFAGATLSVVHGQARPAVPAGGARSVPQQAGVSPSSLVVISQVTLTMDSDLLGTVQNIQGIPANGQGGAGQTTMDLVPANPAAAQRLYEARQCLIQGQGARCPKDMSMAQYGANGGLVRTSVFHHALVTALTVSDNQGAQTDHLTLTYDSVSSQ